jgi:hypothetical protein
MPPRANQAQDAEVIAFKNLNQFSDFEWVFMFVKKNLWPMPNGISSWH